MIKLNTLVVFLHVVGAVGFATGIFISLYGLVALRRATRVEQARTIFGLMGLAGPISAISLLVTIGAGIFLASRAWNWSIGWIQVAAASMVLLIAVGAVMGIRRAAIAKTLEAAPDGPLSAALTERIRDPLFGSSVLMLLALLLGVVFLMVTKVSFEGSLLTILVAAALGVVVSLPLWVRQPVPHTPVETVQRREAR